MKKIHGKMMKGITTKSQMMLLTLAGSSYCHAQQATIVVSNVTSESRTELISLNMSEIKEKLGNTTPKKGEAYIVKTKRGQQVGSQITHDGFLLIDASVLSA